MNKIFAFLYSFCIIILMVTCQSNTTPKVDEISFPEALEPKKRSKYGFDLDLYKVVKKKILSGDTFSSILENHGMNYPEVYNILQAIKSDVDVKRLVIGKPYQLLYTKDSVPTPKAFIYENDVRSYKVIQLRDSIYGIQINKPIKLVLRKGTGLIESSLYETMTKSGLNDQLTYYLSDVYAWNIDFYRLQKGDRFKVIYLEKFVDDTISVGIERIKAAFFQHAGKEFYAFEFQPDSINGIVEYFDESAKNLRRAFLKAPVKFGPVTSRYNLKEELLIMEIESTPPGADFAARIGTPILATTDGFVTKSSYTRGNGNYVTIKHNNKYSTILTHETS